MTGRTKRSRAIALSVAVLALGALLGTTSRAEQITFEDIPLGPDGTTNVFGLYQAPGSAFLILGDFQARGPGADSALTPETSEGSGVITTSLAPFGGGVITLTQQDSLPFDLQSIDLAREFLFNNPSAGVSYPEVTFTGIKTDGSTVSQTFSVDQEGFFFRTFTFSADFSNLVLVNWTQPLFGTTDPDDPNLILGLHQFDNIVVDVSVNVIPEPSSISMFCLGVVGIGLGGRTLRRRRACSGS